MDLQRRLEQLLARYALPRDAADRLAALCGVLSDPEAPTSVHDPRGVLDVHLADSLAGFEVAELRTADVIADLGSGAGLPGLVLAATLPETHVVLVDSQRRKCTFLADAAQAMGLHNAEVVCARVEEWHEGFGRCDVVTARAVAPLPVLCEYAAPVLREGGLLVAWKGAIDADETANAAGAAAMLGLSVEAALAVVPYPGSERRTIQTVRKVASTPSGFPRRAGMATKRPLPAKKGR